MVNRCILDGPITFNFYILFLILILRTFDFHKVGEELRAIKLRPPVLKATLLFFCFYILIWLINVWIIVLYKQYQLEKYVGTLTHAIYDYFSALD